MIKFAYVDPGTGSVAIQAIIGGVMGVSYMARTQIKNLISKFKKGPRAGESKDN